MSPRLRVRRMRLTKHNVIYLTFYELYNLNIAMMTDSFIMRSRYNFNYSILGSESVGTSTDDTPF